MGPNVAVALSSVQRGQSWGNCFKLVFPSNCKADIAVLFRQNNHKVLLQLIDVEYGKSNINETAMLTLFDRCLRSDLELEHRVAFSQRKLEFLEDFGSTVAR